MDGVLLKEEASKCETLLGCKISSDLKWTQHINALKSKLSKRLIGLNNLRYTCPFVLRKIIAEGIFNSVIGYCLPVFGGMVTSDLKDLQILQNKAARIVCNASPRSNRQALFKKLDWFSVNQMISYFSLIAIFKVRINSDPEYLARVLCRNGRNDRILLQNPKLAVAAKSFCYRGPSLWNSLPWNVRKAEKLETFKKLVKPWILENIAQFDE